jgi:hypothetical protein
VNPEDPKTIPLVVEILFLAFVAPLENPYTSESGQGGKEWGVPEEPGD